jgi:hypothetical protein
LFKGPVFKPFTASSKNTEVLEEKARISKFKKSSNSLLFRHKPTQNKGRATIHKLRQNIIKDKMDMMEDKKDILEDKNDITEGKNDIMEDKNNIIEEAMEAKTEVKNGTMKDQMKMANDIMEVKKETEMEDKIKVLKTKPNYQRKYVFTDVYEPNWKSLFV